jgi:hypothetical protein
MTETTAGDAQRDPCAHRLRRALARLATTAPVAVFPVVGRGGRDLVRRLELEGPAELASSPRGASVLLVAGQLPRALWDPAIAVHDQLSPPRATVLWDAGETPFADAPLVHTVDEAAALVRRLARDADLGNAGEPPVRLDVDPVEWRGVGPYGQGGTGMTGGTPYGRPMTDRAPDRDGLRLDQLLVRIGPFLPGLPPGLALDVKLQGDVVQEAAVADNPFAGGASGPVARLDDPFERALVEPVPIAELELARARHHLLWLAEALRVQGLAAAGRRSLRLGFRLTAAAGPAFDRLCRLVVRSQVLRWSLPTAADDVVAGEPDLGPVSRAAGHPTDARRLDPAYRALGFEPVTQRGGDVASRWRQRLAETDQALALARAAGDTESSVTDVVEGPRGPISRDGPSASARLLPLLPRLLAGREWGDAVATIVSLDLDVEDAARRPLTEALVSAGPGGPP